MRLFKVYLRSLLILWTHERGMTLSIALTAVFVGCMQWMEPVLFGRVIDALSGKGSVWDVLLLWGGLSTINIIASVFLSVSADRLSHRRRLDLLDEVFERAIALPMSYHTEQGTGRVVHSILSGTDQLFHLWLSFLREHLAALIGIVLLVPLALTMNSRMAALLFGLAVIYVFANYFIIRRTHGLQEKVATHYQNVFSRVGDVVGNVTVVQSYTRLMQEIKGLQNITAQLLTAQYPILTWWGVLSVITRVASTITMVLILGVGAWFVTRGEMSVGEVVSFASFSGILIGKLDQLSGFMSQLVTRAPALQLFYNLLDQPGAAQELPNARVLQNPRGDVEFRQVSFVHKNSDVGVFDLSFRVPAGQTVALVGPSGSGKTTTLALLQRLFDPKQGRIEIDGEDIRGFTLASLRHSIATVFQESGLFNRSIAENIRIGRPEATDEEVRFAAAQADAHEFILQKPGAYDFVIGERGNALSGGERQRIAIARAILKNAPILIFDEATSALDNKTEKRIQNAIHNLRMHKKTTFIIAHRLSTVVAADQILVFEKGRIVEAGTFEELRSRDGLFATLLKMGELTPPTRTGGELGHT